MQYRSEFKYCTKGTKSTCAYDHVKENADMKNLDDFSEKVKTKILLSMAEEIHIVLPRVFKALWDIWGPLLDKFLERKKKHRRVRNYKEILRHINKGPGKIW